MNNYFLIFSIIIIIIIFLLIYSYSYNYKKKFIENIKFYEIDKLLLPRINENYKQKIPKIIHQTAGKSKIPQGMKQALDSWINLNPEYTYKFYDNEDCRNYIQKHFDQNTLKAFDLLIPGAYKADLFRYCVLYNEGGVYADCGMIDYIPLKEIINQKDEFITPIDGGYIGGLYNAFICSTPKHPILDKTLKIVVNRVLNREYGYRDLYPTGPIAFGDALSNLYSINNDFKEGYYNNIKLLLRDNKYGEKYGSIYDKDRKLIKSKYPTYFLERSTWNKDVGYSTLWNERKIYKE